MKTKWNIINECTQTPQNFMKMKSRNLVPYTEAANLFNSNFINIGLIILSAKIDSNNTQFKRFLVNPI